MIGLTSSVVMAQDSYRLAYSKKDDIEIYIDNSTAENWCQTDLTLQVKGGEDASLERFSALLPKLGGLFAAQCPQASTLTWSYVDATNTLLAKGASSADSQWGYQLTEQLVVPVTAVAETVNDTSQNQQATAPPAPLVETAAQVVKSTTPDESPIENSETVVSEMKTAYFPLSSIQIGDWMPPTKEQREALTNGALTVRKNQEGCQLISQFNFGVQSDYIEIQTTDVLCEQGYLHGAGKIQLVRSDGAVVMRPRDVWFYHGLA